jgi:hypothetical protein
MLPYSILKPTEIKLLYSSGCQFEFSIHTFNDFPRLIPSFYTCTAKGELLKSQKVVVLKSAQITPDAM